MHTNHDFPIIFFYKGWKVTINDVTNSLTLADLKVAVEIKPNKDLLEHQLEERIAPYNPFNEVENATFIKDNYGIISNESQFAPEVEQELKSIISKFCELNNGHSYTIRLYGDAVDVLMGRNLSCVNKAKMKAINYIDQNLGSIKEKLITYIKNNKTIKDVQ